MRLCRFPWASRFSFAFWDMRFPEIILMGDVATLHIGVCCVYSRLGVTPCDVSLRFLARSAFPIYSRDSRCSLAISDVFVVVFVVAAAFNSPSVACCFMGCIMDFMPGCRASPVYIGMWCVFITLALMPCGSSASFVALRFPPLLSRLPSGLLSCLCQHCLGCDGGDIPRQRAFCHRRPRHARHIFLVVVIVVVAVASFSPLSSLPQQSVLPFGGTAALVAVIL